MTRRRLLIATRNAGKLRELAELLVSAPFELVSLDDVGVDEEVDETGETFEQNAALKAETYCRLSGLPTLADDSGLEVDALGGEPGVRSARYAGDDASDGDRIAFLIGKLDNIPEDKWSARFRCVVAVAWPDQPTELYSGACEGRIVRRGRGDNGFGYDPVFYIPELGKTLAELTPVQKNRISHRSGAAKKASAALSEQN
ncbi:MAG: XTP/dITP diphosphatase [SAR202 cluster bacterium]|jgi:XTP/dITP diphosphohydrolase|nr:XTP/dITP diphosphatase [SAR202 cluster bacterium]MDP6662921.1 XTP/dITP diphosphatase [SAR202 cluster bacterium]MDP6800237.1 XTP/dITP diphosphatase [SAR202 cluster bacterium]MQG57443.1 XTP/dITP diphosphatase [SAR202 cluster bacterium]MQG68687.1 XTP/dITP diphosphatase [SAR202 cluster bacterium]|tara:strand:- start:10250 stop:10849 length:600 start_codon:yes stop_codon:yes gene_type:complete